MFSYQAIFIKNPTNVYNYVAYLEPMAYLSWVIVVVFLIFTPPFLYLVFRYNPNDHDSVSLAESYSAVLVTVSMMGAPYFPTNISARTIFLRYVFFIIFRSDLITPLQLQYF